MKRTRAFQTVVASMTAVPMVACSSLSTGSGDAAAQDLARQADVEPFEMQPRFILRFQNRPMLEAALVDYRANPGRAEAAFKRWAKSYPDMGVLELQTASYVGEAIVTVEHITSASSEQDLRDMATQLRGLPDIAYADPDFTARAGSKGQ